MGSRSSFYLEQDLLRATAQGGIQLKPFVSRLKVKINATKYRVHRISTIYASLVMSLEHQRIFRDHMGHEAAISRDNYQCTIGIKEVRIWESCWITSTRYFLILSVAIYNATLSPQIWFIIDVTDIKKMSMTYAINGFLKHSVSWSQHIQVRLC
jgi:hypothetical protein